MSDQELKNGTLDFISDRDWELISSIQKFIRRGLEIEAGRAFFELVEGGHFSWVISRMKIIAYEDIGMGDLQSMMVALKCIEDCKEFYDKKTSAWRLCGAMAIMILCRAKKSRESDHFQGVCLSRNEKDKIEIPDYALDKHTRRGKSMGRGIKHFREVASKLNNKAKENDPYEDEAYEYWLSKG